MVLLEQQVPVLQVLLDCKVHREQLALLDLAAQLVPQALEQLALLV